MTPPPYKKALQPPHPGEKQLGQAISPPACQHGVPVYPVRYGITDSAFHPAISAHLSTAGYPALVGGKVYGIRTLRPGTYVYLSYIKDGRMWTQHYQVMADARFAQIWWNQKDDASDAPGSVARPDEAGAKPYLIAPETKVADTVYLFVSDTLLTHRTLYRIETNEGGVRDKLATKVKPAGGAEQTHAFSAQLLGYATPELQMPAISGASPFPWSEIQYLPSRPDVSRIMTGMVTALMPRKDIVPLGVALQDPIGIASELNYLCHNEVKRRDTYAAQSKHQLQSAALIKGYFKQLEASPEAKLPDGKSAIDKQKGLVKFKDLQAFKPAYDKQMKTYDAPIKNTVLDVVAWMRQLDKTQRLGVALGAFDLACERNAFDYEIAVLNCIGASVHSDDGLMELAKLIEANPTDSPLWKAMGAGDELLMDRLSRYLTVSQGVFNLADAYVEKHAGTATTNILAGMVQHYVATAPEAKAKVSVLRLRHVAERRFGITLGYIEVTVEQFARYTLELQGYMAMGEEVVVRWGLDLHASPGELPGTTRVQGRERIEVWEYQAMAAATAHATSQPMELTGNPLLRNLKRMRDMAIVKAGTVRAPAGIAFTGIGGVLAMWTMRGAMKDLANHRNLTSWTSVAGATLGILGSGIEITTLSLSMLMKSRGNAVLAQTIVKLGFKWGTTYAGSAAASIMAVADLIRAANAANAGNTDQAAWALGSALAGAVLAVATFAGGSATLATLAAGGEAVAVLGFTPIGWLVISALAVGAGAYCAWKYATNQFSPVDIWLAHSAWGTEAKRYTLSQELEAWHSLHFRPSISTSWDNAGDTPFSRLLATGGTLRLRCTLPQISAQEYFDSRITVTLRGKTLTPISPAAVKTPGGIAMNLDEQYIQMPLTDGQGVERGWAIGMHQDAQVSLTYVYLPYRQRMPDIGLEQQGAPKPLVFTSGGWLRDPIDPAKLAPVSEPA
ncbi:toxin VasX [Dyella sp. 20L07]|uniref:toxin VasX n=1 Tax=Dyella sp. 20L07 TaxID=3384240 RepID=UPI003D2C11CC